MSGRKWMEKEENYLRDNYGPKLSRDIAKELDRTVNAVRLKAGRMGLDGFDGKRPDFSEEFLREEYWNKGKTLSQIADENRCNMVTVYNYMKLHGISRRLRGRKEAVDFTQKDKLSYILGVVVGDGWIYKADSGAHRICLEVTDEVFANSFSSVLEDIGINTCFSHREREDNYGNKPYTKVQSCSIELYKWLEDKISDMSNLKEFVYSKGSIVNFAKGLYESDGGFSDNGVKFYSQNTKLLNIVKELMTSINFNFTGPYQGKNVYSIQLARVDEIKKFFSIINPCIKDPTYYEEDLFEELEEVIEYF